METPAYSFRVVWNPEDEVYVASCSEFEGVSGFGETAEAALKEVQISLELAVETYDEEGWTLPEVQQISEYSGQFRLRMPRRIHALLAQRAADEEVSLNTYALLLISNGLGQSDAFHSMKKEIVSLVFRATQVGGRNAAVASTTSKSPSQQGFLASAANGGTRWQN